MEKRKPYNLKGLLAVYNLSQVVACCYLISGILSNEFNIIKFWKCQAVDYNTNNKSIEILTYSYHTFLLKLLELVETVFFVMRKKQNQVSKLHVYHHVSTAILGWIMVKYTGGKCEIPSKSIRITQFHASLHRFSLPLSSSFVSGLTGGMILFSVVLNSFVHVIMYSYYFAALFGPAVQRKLESIKKSITVIQMVSAPCPRRRLFPIEKSLNTEFVAHLDFRHFSFYLFSISDSIHHHFDTMCSRFGQRLWYSEDIGCHLRAKRNVDILHVLRFLQKGVQKEINGRAKSTESTLNALNRNVRNHFVEAV